MSNFHYLSTEWPTIYREAVEAEKLCFTSPKASCTISRSALELAINWLYDNDYDLERPYDDSLNGLMKQRGFKEIVKPSIYRSIDLIRLTGNNAAHGHKIEKEDSLTSLKGLFRFLSFVALCYAEEKPNIPEFDGSLIPTGKEQEILQKRVEEIQAKLDEALQDAANERKEKQDKAKESEEWRSKFEAHKSEMLNRRERRVAEVEVAKVIPELLTEKETRERYIDQYLKDAGWTTLRPGTELEYPLVGMPKEINPSGTGSADYVLWDDNGLPLAVIEAKRTQKDPKKGKQQALLYADCLEQMTGQRPVIFYTNGFDIYIWDDKFYSERKIHGFYSKDQLQLLIQRRTTRRDLRDFQMNLKITDRPYQDTAIKRVAETFCTSNSDGQTVGGNRGALLVMATGAGKTRTSASIVDMLTRYNWAKRILFLADRTELVRQAKHSFSEHLPQLSSVNLLESDAEEVVKARLVFSTYHTMLNRIDKEQFEGKRLFGVGYFDLIIIDEAHRSVYQKFRAIFQYFDSILLGLTATPKNSVDHNTYGLFGLKVNMPTFAYELKQAVEDKHLVPKQAFSVPLGYMRENIKYSELSPQEQEEYEEKFGDPTEGAGPDEVEKEAVHNWLFNTDTVDKALAYLMKHGLKVEGGDKLGKSIIFAKNHDHAVFIEERFNQRYPQYSNNGHFLRVIDNREPLAQDLIAKFKDPHEERDPQIAVSVDMLDTGIDAPRVVNLVLFKPVKSASKFWQMIGRGTRKCPDLFGPGQDKTHFVVFDFCKNLEFFEDNERGIESRAVKSMAHQIFEAKLDILQFIGTLISPSEEDLEAAAIYREQLHQQVLNLDRERFDVKMELELVEEFSAPDRWSSLKEADFKLIEAKLGVLMVPEKGDDEMARRFDLLMLNLGLIALRGQDIGPLADKVMNNAGDLLGKKNIPMIAAKQEVLERVLENEFWAKLDIPSVEMARTELRQLMKFLDRKAKQLVYTHFSDAIDEGGVVAKDLLKLSDNLEEYRKEIEKYVWQNKDHLTVMKLRNNQPITQAELGELERMLFEEDKCGTKEQFEESFGEEPLGKFIRSIVGLEMSAAQKAFGEFLSRGNLNSQQSAFINKIISYLEKNGTIDSNALYFSPPFTLVADDGMAGVFEDSADSERILGILNDIDRNAEVA